MLATIHVVAPLHLCSLPVGSGDLLSFSPLVLCLLSALHLPHVWQQVARLLIPVIGCGLLHFIDKLFVPELLVISLKPVYFVLVLFALLLYCLLFLLHLVVVLLLNAPEVLLELHVLLLRLAIVR